MLENSLNLRLSAGVDEKKKKCVDFQIELPRQNEMWK